MTPQEVIERVLELDKAATKGPWQELFIGGPLRPHRVDEWKIGKTGSGHRHIKVEFDGRLSFLREHDAELIAFYRSAAVQCARALRIAMDGLVATEAAHESWCDLPNKIGSWCNCDKSHAFEALQEINNIFNGTDAGDEG